MQHKKIVFLASDCESSRWVYNAIAKDFSIEAAIIEQPISKKTLFKGRVKRIGFVKVLWQVMFSVLVVPRLRKKAATRKNELIARYSLDNADFTAGKTYYIPSVNDEACQNLLQQLQPGIVIVNGTRIISKKILQTTQAVFINMHVGITPWYRGSHGGYWALYNNDVENFGTTIHLVDAGVDTGGVLKQVFAKPSKADNFTTYPVIQVGEGIQGMISVVKNIMDDTITPVQPKEKGNMYYQPGIWQYLLKKIN